MKRKSFLVACVATMLAVGVTIAADQPKDKNKQVQNKGKQHAAGSTDQMWSQIANLHFQIVKAEAANAPGAKSAAGQQSNRGQAQQQKQADNQDATKQQERRDAIAKSLAERQKQASDEEGRGFKLNLGNRDQQKAMQTNPQTAKLWKQVGELHAQIVRLKLMEQGGQSTFTNQADRNAAAAEQPQQKAGDSEIQQLWQQIGQLQQQILELELAQVTGGEASKLLRPGFDNQQQDNQNTDRPKTQDQQEQPEQPDQPQTQTDEAVPDNARNTP